MTKKSVPMRLQGLRPRARVPTCPPCYATDFASLDKRTSMHKHNAAI